jgi:hypothetical protein
VGREKAILWDSAPLCLGSLRLTHYSLPFLYGEMNALWELIVAELCCTGKVEDR